MRVRRHLLRPEDYVRMKNVSSFNNFCKIKKRKRQESDSKKFISNECDTIIEDSVIVACNSNIPFILFWFVVCVVLYKMYKLMHWH